MDINRTVSALNALAQSTRLQVFRLIMRAGPRGLSAGLIAEAVDVPQNTLSGHLSVMARAGLVRARRESRSIFYSADLSGTGALLTAIVQDCCDGHPELCDNLTDVIDRSCRYVQQEKPMSTASDPGKSTSTRNVGDKPFNVLFLCTGNSARSVMAEAILNRIGAGKFRAFSAGSHPKGAVHPQTLDLLRRLRHDVTALRSKDWSEFSVPGAPELDFVFTVCDNAANEVCPVWPGQPMSAHWGVPDPALATGKDSEIALAFADAYRMLNNRISIFISLPVAKLDRLTLQKRLREIGSLKGEPADA